MSRLDEMAEQIRFTAEVMNDTIEKGAVRVEHLKMTLAAEELNLTYLDNARRCLLGYLLYMEAKAEAAQLKDSAHHQLQCTHESEDMMIAVRLADEAITNRARSGVPD